ncbi:hypothetical protein BCR42DRAFT_52998 [Absidia repens]|uniref:Putative zinc-finger domain-containing protein n=1 Tax=Absidia repens TaxID=90262 RepID=A0A1X2IDQ0_9FUNG|nr:hypothetical protein BCR42DRAFT_52998 [Absidia repens]
MASDSDDDIFLTPPSSPVIQPFEGTESLDLAQWKLDILSRAYVKLETRKKELELEEKRTMALLSKVSLKLKKSSKSTVERKANTDTQSPLGVKTKPTIAKKTLSRPPNSMNASIAAPATYDQQYTTPSKAQQYTNPPPEQQQRNVSQPPPASTSQASGYFPVLLSPVPVRQLPPYDHNLLQRRIECSEQADNLYRQLEHRLDTRYQQLQTNHQTVSAAPAVRPSCDIPPSAPAGFAASSAPAIRPTSAVPPPAPAAPVATSSTATPPTAPATKASAIATKPHTLAPNPPLGPAARYSTVAAQRPAGPATTTTKGHSTGPSTSVHHPAPPTAPFFRNQLPTIPPQSWPQKPGYMPDQQYSNYPYQPNSNNNSNSNNNKNRVYPAVDHYQAHGSNLAYYEQQYQPTDNSWSARNQHYSRPNHQNYQAAPEYSTNHQWIHQTHASYSAARSASSSTPQFMAWQAPQPYYNSTGASATTATNTKSQRPMAVPPANKQPSVPPAKPKGNSASNSAPPPLRPAPQSSSETTAISSVAKTLKKQNYQSPLVTFGIHPEQSTKTTPKSKRVDKPLCVFEAEGGTCNDDTCHSMHFRDF